jgi:hypothetical protein
MKWGKLFINVQSFSRSFSSLRDVEYELGKWYDTAVLLECDASCLFVTYIASAQTEEYAAAFKYLFKH